eukprot:809425-Alexandrium_andersonii.AAC.1
MGGAGRRTTTRTSQARRLSPSSSTPRLRPGRGRCPAAASAGSRFLADAAAAAAAGCPPGCPARLHA